MARRTVERHQIGDPVLFFETIWRRLSECGFCDDYGGAESRRVLRQWIRTPLCQSGNYTPSNVAGFICMKANSRTEEAV